MTLQAIRVKNFKCFPDLRLPLARFTLLTGFNAAGKSTAIQGLLLLAQASRYDTLSDAVPLAGPLVRLGLPGDILSANVGGRTVKVELETDEGTTAWTLEPKELAVGMLHAREGVLTPLSGPPIHWKNKVWPALLPTAPGAKELRRLRLAVRGTILISAVRAGALQLIPCA